LYNSAMPAVPYLVRKRELRRKKKRRNPASYAGLASSMVLSLLGALLIITASWGYTRLIRNLPSLEALPALLDPPNGVLLQPTRLYDRTGENLILTLEHPAAEDREYLYVDLDEEGDEGPSAPAVLIAATLSIQDPTFWNHPGFTLQGLTQGGHPTIAQRLVDKLLLWDEASGISRSLRERVLAAQITSHYGRGKVLEWYLNSARYGNGIYGADAGARAYFGKSAADLTIYEAGVLAAAADTPDLNPFSTPQSARERGKQVIELMAAQGFITEEQALQSAQQTITFRSEPEARSNIAPAYTQLVIEQLAERFDRARLEQGGLIIYTSLDYDLQVQASCTARIQLDRLQNGIPGEGSVIDDCEAARLLPTQSFINPIPGSELAANAAVIDPVTGQVLALVGGTAPEIDPTRLPGRPPGTMMTPFIYLTAFTRGYTPSTLVWDIPSNLPENLAELAASQLDFHGPVRTRTAFVNDYIAPALNILAQVGAENVWRTAQEMGLYSLALSDLSRYLSDTPLLNGGEVTLLEMTRAFGVLANQGILAGQIGPTMMNPASGTPPIDPIAVIKVTDVDGRTWLDCSDRAISCSIQKRPIVTSQLAYLVTHILSDETARWPSLGHPNHLEIGRPAAAKIGVASNPKSAWTVGYTPQIVAGVWTGPVDRNLAPETREEQENALQNSAAAYWHAIIQYASRDLPVQTWSIPANITQVEVCDPSGMLPTAYCPTVITEVFLAGTEPSHQDTLFQVFQINHESGRLATVFTPPNLVNERVYLVAPPEALEWAAQAGLPTPPEDYDIVYSPRQASPSLDLTSPVMFAHVGGLISIDGTAGGDGFSFYRLQVGKGLNPRVWLQIGEDADKPVKGGVLGEWDTEGLSGLYAVRLMVVMEDQRVETTVVQVTVDNTAPVVSISEPENGQRMNVPKNQTLILKATSTDDVSLERVEFSINGEFLASMVEAPYFLAWQAEPGRHTLVVRAVDLAGNASEDTVEFVLEE
jgi:membrane peptidoglycan carboxypeptidase